MPAHASRFTAHFATLSFGALTVISALAFRPQTAAWITLGLGAATVLAVLVAFAFPDQGAGARSTEVLLGLAGAWTIVSSRAFSDPHVVKWLCLANGILIWALGGLGLIAHEVLVEARLGRLVAAERYRLEMTRRTDAYPLGREATG